MRVLLIYPNIIESPKEISYGLASISAMLKQDGHTIGLIDTTFGGRGDEEILKQARAFKPELICVSVATNDFKYGIHIIDIIKKEFPNALAIVGGIHATIAPDEVINQKNVDMVCVGEGDLAIKEIVDLLESKKHKTDILNIWFKKDGKIIPNSQRPLPNLDDLPMPDRGLFDFQRYVDWHGGVATVISTRGCPFPCTYCVNRKHKEIYKESGIFVRYKSVDKLLNEIKLMVDNYRINEILFNDDTFTLNPKRIKEFCEKYPKLIGKIPFAINGRVNTITREMMFELAKAGCSKISIGVECGNPKIRNEILERNMTDEEIIQTFQWAKEAGIKTYAFNMIGIPYETKENIQETIELNRKINPDYVGVSIFTAFPGTPLYDLCKKNNWLDENYSMSYFQDTNIKHPNFKIDELKKIRDSFGFEVYKKTKPLRAYVDLIDKKFTRYNWYMRVRSGLIKAGFKKILNLWDKENFFEVKK